MEDRRLAGEAPELDRLVRAADDASRRRAAVAASKAAVASSGLDDERAAKAREALVAGHSGNGPERAALSDLVDSVDELGWSLQASLDTGEASEEEYNHAFERARAASALWHAFDTDPLAAASGSIYEALARLRARHVGEWRLRVADTPDDVIEQRRALRPRRL
jgi:hypothetical protein